MMASQHGRRLLLASSAFAIVFAIAAGIAYKHTWHGPGDSRIDTVVRLRTDADFGCDTVSDPKTLHLKIRGIDTGLHAAGCEAGDDKADTADEKVPHILVLLRHNARPDVPADVDEAAWMQILGHPLQTLRERRELQYEIFQDQPDKSRKKIASSSFFLYIFDWTAPFAFAVVLLVWAALIYLGRYTGLLRDAAAADAELKTRTYSLAKTQMAWWFAIIFASFVFLWLVTGETPSISAQALSFLGIASATTLASIGISAGNTSNEGQAGVFFHDLLSDANGISIARFQMLVMTIVLGLMFLFDVATRLIMPEFDASLLTLMGISAGTYVGLKIPETQAAKP